MLVRLHEAHVITTGGLNLDEIWQKLINPWEYLTSNEVPFRAKLVTVQVLVGVGIRAAAANLCLKVPSFWLLVKNGLSKN